ncbi:RNA pseudouridylate synthase domain-containing protein 2 [Echinococcus granulosus]|nr:RNA pseudouridylate synthase domain-containing protein 2 [Echinococcus granulosus]EUB59017.1 RNA pseudouridylate synthase domain-containing protein 2 [Echinococcus granulosus]
MAFCKRRWVSCRLLDVLDKEFNFDEMDVIVQRISSGQIRINGDKVPVDYILQDSDLLEHSVHRHELPILDKPIDVVFEDDNVLVVNKPPSMPIHPCGQYHHNSLVKILHNEKGMKNLRAIHRLDRMTSGLVLIGKTYEAAMKISSQISDREVSKFYIAEVEGQFKGPTNSSPGGTANTPTPVVVDQPLGRLNSRLGLNAVLPESEGGKPAKTAFVPLLWKKPKDVDNPGSTVVLCRLYTGRTHQVRIHLQYLGFPIVDDPLYNSYDWGESKGAFAKYREPRSELLAALAASRSRSTYLKTAITDRDAAAPNAKNDEDDNNDAEDDTISEEASLSPPKISRLSPRSEMHHYNESTVDEATRNLLEAAYRADCPDCNRRFPDPKPSSLVLHLHAYRYAGSDWSYSVPPPEWALESIQLDELEARIAELLPLL